MIEHKVTCDGCGNDITYTGNSVGYRLKLSSEEIPIKPGIGCVTDMWMEPSIKSTKNFCWTPCLEKWVKEGMK